MKFKTTVFSLLMAFCVLGALPLTAAPGDKTYFKAQDITLIDDVIHLHLSNGDFTTDIIYYDMSGFYAFTDSLVPVPPT